MIKNKALYKSYFQNIFKNIKTKGWLRTIQILKQTFYSLKH